MVNIGINEEIIDEIELVIFDKDGTLVKKPEYDNAILHYKKAISINKNYAKAHYNLGLVFKIQKNYDESRKHLERAIKIMNDYSKAHFHLAMLLKETGDEPDSKRSISTPDVKNKTSARSKN